MAKSYNIGQRIKLADMLPLIFNYTFKFIIIAQIIIWLKIRFA